MWLSRTFYVPERGHRVAKHRAKPLCRRSSPSYTMVDAGHGALKRAAMEFHFPHCVLIHRSAWKGTFANFVLKLSDNPG
jgi:hypothetical protein